MEVNLQLKTKQNNEEYDDLYVQSRSQIVTFKNLNDSYISNSSIWGFISNTEGSSLNIFKNNVNLHVDLIANNLDEALREFYDRMTLQGSVFKIANVPFGFSNEYWSNALDYTGYAKGYTTNKWYDYSNQFAKRSIVGIDNIYNCVVRYNFYDFDGDSTSEVGIHTYFVNNIYEGRIGNVTEFDSRLLVGAQDISKSTLGILDTQPDYPLSPIYNPITPLNASYGFTNFKSLFVQVAQYVLIIQKTSSITTLLYYTGSSVTTLTRII